MPTAKYKKRKDGRYCTKIDYGRDEDTGKRKYVMLYARTISELELKKANVMSSMDKRIFVEPNKIMFKDYSKQWLGLKRAAIELNTYKMYDSVLRNHLFVLDELILKDITKYDVQCIINKNLDHPRICETIKVTINQILNNAIDDGIIYKNVCRNLTLPKKVKPKKRPLTHEEDILSEVTEFDEQELAYIKLIKYCGLRRGEALALTKKDINLKTRLVNVQNVAIFDSNKTIIKTIPKSATGVRRIPLPDKGFLFLEYYIKNLTREYLFTNRTDPTNIITLQGFRKMWESIINKMNEKANELKYDELEGLTSHVFRHNYATMLYYAGVPIKEAQKLLGHSSVNMTMDIYTHLEEDNDMTTQKLNIFLSNKQNTA